MGLTFEMGSPRVAAAWECDGEREEELCGRRAGGPRGLLSSRGWDARPPSTYPRACSPLGWIRLIASYRVVLAL